MIPINKPMIGEEERREVLEVLDKSSSLTSPSKDGGKKVREFEQLLRQFLHVKHAIAVNSGTAALYSSLLALGLKYGEEVILPSFTFVATANAVVAAGGKPVFVDISKNRQDYNMSVKLVGVWVLGGVFMLLGTWIVQNLEFNVGVSGFSYAIAILIAFVLFLLTGLAWISVAVATRHKFG